MSDTEKTLLVPKQFRRYGDEIAQAQRNIMQQARVSINGLSDPVKQEGQKLYYDALNTALGALKEEVMQRAKQADMSGFSESDAANLVNEAFNDALDAHVDTGKLDVLRSAHGGKEAYGAQRTQDMTNLMDMAAAILHEVAEGRLERQLH